MESSTVSVTRGLHHLVKISIDPGWGDDACYANKYKFSKLNKSCGLLTKSNPNNEKLDNAGLAKAFIA